MKIVKWLYKLIRSFCLKMRDDSVSAYSAQTTLFIIISFFPFAMFLMTLFRYLPVTEMQLLEMAANILPANVDTQVTQIIQEVYRSAITSNSTILSITVITTLVSGSTGFLAIIRGLNTVYGKRETRNYFLLRILSACYALILALLMVILSVLLLFGNTLYAWLVSNLPWLSSYVLPTVLLRVGGSFLLMFLFFIAIYVVIPSRKTKIRREIPGALLASVGWFGFSYLYSFYIEKLSSPTAYGSLTSVVLLMLWLYICIYILFVGAEFNAWLTANADKLKTNV
ncbi:YihY/virulence factor BrkB family protein [Anaerolentibacter hominis]|uniref:YihY/virulence factor BrkB family protein n=1 Tax=Anaerolentibacter hominis TaxID=3079009 RepID=UPI0031B89365